MKPQLIVMLTHEDQTVAHGLELFCQLRDAPVQHWGFKDVGLETKAMGELVSAMKQAGKTTYLEVVSLTEEQGLRGAQLARGLGFDVLMGTTYSRPIREALRGSSVKYYPFVGPVHGHPSILTGTVPEIVHHAKQLAAEGVAGIDLLTYRFGGDARDLLRRVVSVVKIPVVSAGSIDTHRRVAEVWQAGAWAFTVGSAFFENRFAPDGGFVSNTLALATWLEQTTEIELARYLS